MKRMSIATTAIIALALTLAGCTTAPAETPAVTTMTPPVSPSATQAPSPSVASEPGTRGNPLAVNEMRKFSTKSMFSVGAAAATVVSDGYVTLPLRVGLDWDAARAQSADVESQGVSVASSLRISYVAASGRSYDTYDYAIPVENELYDAGAVYPPAESLSANQAVSVPNADIPGGAWKIANTNGDVLFLVGAP